MAVRRIGWPPARRADDLLRRCARSASCRPARAAAQLRTAARTGARLRARRIKGAATSPTSDRRSAGSHLTRPRLRATTESALSLLYQIALFGVALAIVVVTVEAMVSVSRPAPWRKPKAKPALQLVAVIERREQALPFVGAERRGAACDEARVGSHGVA